MKILRQAFPKAGPVLFGLLAGASLVGFALPALGDDAPPHQGTSAANGFRVTRPEAFISKSSGLKVRYLAGQGTIQASAEDGLTLKCPKKTPHAISSFFGPTTKEGLGQVVLSDSLPTGKTNRSWDVGVKNLSPTPLPFVAGVVCIQ